MPTKDVASWSCAARMVGVSSARFVFQGLHCKLLPGYPFSTNHGSIQKWDAKVTGNQRTIASTGPGLIRGNGSSRMVGLKGNEEMLICLVWFLWFWIAKGGFPAQTARPKPFLPHSLTYCTGLIYNGFLPEDPSRPDHGLGFFLLVVLLPSTSYYGNSPCRYLNLGVRWC